MATYDYAPVTFFGETRMAPVVVMKNRLIIHDKLGYDEVLWIEKPEDEYAMMADPSKRFRVIFRVDWPKYPLVSEAT